MGVNMGVFTFYSIIVALPAALIGGWLYGLYLGKKYPFTEDEVKGDFRNEEQITSNGKQPSLFLSLFVLLLPIVLILLGTVLSVLLPKNSAMSVFFSFLGDKNIALLIGVIVAILAMKPYLKDSIENVISRAATSAGMILLITGAGGSFGKIINESGIGNYVVETFSRMNIPMVVLAFVLSQLLRAAQGSTTVALVTTSSILGPLAAKLGVSPVLVGLAICAGGIGLSLPNDSGFWVVNRFSKFDIKKTMEAWTVGGTIAGVIAFIMVLILNIFASKLPGLH